MTPAPVAFYFGPDEKRRFGWYHAAAGTGRSTVVVLCNPIGDDYVRAHRALRHLAERLAAAGFAVVRFDFLGTGDSAGSERDAGLVDDWRADVALAAAEGQRRSGAAAVALVGLGLGATLAASARAQSLVLWSPFASGAAFVKESVRMHAVLKMLEPEAFASQPPGWSAGGQEALGFLLTPTLIEALRGVDLASTPGSAADGQAATLFIGTSQAPTADDALVAQLRTRGPVEYRHLPGHKFLTQVNHRSDLPTPILDTIVDWLSTRHPLTAAAPSVSVADSDGDDTPLSFGRAHRLFGILTRPPPALRAQRRPVIILTNAGCVHRIGPHRFYVALARRWAALGFWVLRVDLSGIGDSPAAPGCPENLTYPRDGLADLEDAMAAVTARTALDRFIVIGLCSGGDLAFQLGFADERVAGAVLMNPRTFCVNDLDMVESYKRARYTQGSLFRLSSWKKALRGEVNLVRAASTLAPKAADLVRRRVSQLVQGARHRLRPPPSTSAATPAQNDVPACLASMALRGVDTVIVVSENDPGIDYVDAQFGARMQALNQLRNYRRADFPGTDHTFTSLYAQEQVATLLTEHLVAHHPAR